MKFQLIFLKRKHLKTFVKQLNQFSTIFQNMIQFGELSRLDGDEKPYIKGRDIITIIKQRCDLGTISKYALPWHFVKHYLPSADCKEINKYVRWQAINQYTTHPNATVESLEGLIEWSPDVYFVGDYLDKTAINGKIDILKMIHSRYPNTIMHTNKSVEGAALNGDLQMIQLLGSIDNKGIPIFTSQVMDNAATKGWLEILKWVHQNKSESGTTEQAINKAAENGHFECVKFLVENTKEEGTEEAINMAARNGHFNIVQYLHQHDYICTTRAIDGAAENGHLNIIKYLSENRTEGCSEKAMDLASSNGHLDCVKYLHNHRSEGCTNHAMDEASANGHLEVVKYLHHNRSEGATEKAMDEASANGHLEVVKYLHHNRSEGATEKAMDEASANGHLSIVQFLHDHRTEGFTARAMDEAAENGFVSVIEFLHFNQSEECSPKAITKAAENGHLSVIEFLHCNQSEGFTTKVMDKAAENGHLDVIEFLHCHRTEGYSKRIVKQVVSKGHLDVLIWIHNTLPPTLDGSPLFKAGMIELAHQYINWTSEPSRFHRIIKWLYDNNIGVDESNQHMAASISEKYNSNNTPYTYVMGLDSNLEMLRTPLVNSWNYSLCRAFENGYYFMVLYLIECFPRERGDGILDLPFSQYLSTVDLVCRIGKGTRLKTDIKFKNNYSLIVYLNENDRPTRYAQIDEAAKDGQFSLVSYLYHKGFYCSLIALEESSKCGYLSIIKFLVKHRENERSIVSRPSLTYAASRDKLSCLLFLLRHLRKVSVKGLEMEATNGSLTTLQAIPKFLRDNDPDTLIHAARNGWLTIVQYLYNNNKNNKEAAFKEAMNPQIASIMEPFIGHIRDEAQFYRSDYNHDDYYYFDEYKIVPSKFEEYEEYFDQFNYK
ncbi:hypothetical protein DFA_07742 [Cavenderia fasciculata]|uniref:Ankyrin repeat-containing protein n=1 Tax=Cavenderia fasciculata TaxID=261658 RepID=F4Q342_CACFS|nr:uncharacterized protein DFA_07742 [Cavenderia fasciculata]EGG16764.1 hypothetical protein DFA_07742 [Cavenderia fasciculata]|eukprot:XP_004355238.1 hypothetical protein DFA_07742 [Cavenderia fasciculata]